MKNTIVVDEFGFIVDFVLDEDKEVAQMAAVENQKE